MVELINFNDLDISDVVKRMKVGEIFVYPTDSVYALGCNALKQGSVALIRRIKKLEDNNSLAVIAPNKKWIYSNFEVNKKSYIQTLPGPFTFVLNMKKRCVARNVNPGADEIGVRIPYHAFSRLVQKANIPFIVTNLHDFGKKPVREAKEVPKSIIRQIDTIIDGGFLANQASSIIDLRGDMAKIIKG